MSDSPFQVLVIDDEASVRELTIRSLDRAGFECVPAINGEQALKMIEMKEYDAVVTDLRMPNLNGHALVVDLLAREHRPLIYVVTGVVEPKLAKDLLRRGIDDIFYKPVDHAMLAIKLAARLESQRRRLQRV
ncbi:MAG: response regulator [Planctomycetaceae bacterium]|nr:response regulator [Planctomycetales bacterium]MCB9921464.1 response regulator [Planctomycetaceae bacterium]